MKKLSLVLLVIVVQVILVSDRNRDALRKASMFVSDLSCKKDGWTEFTSVEGSFAVRFPKPPTESPHSDGKDTVEQRNVRVVINENVVYDVGYGWANVQMPPAGSPNEADFRIFKDIVLEAGGKCTSISEGAAFPALQGYIGGRLVFLCPNAAGIEVTHSVNLYLGRSRFYSLSILFPTSDPEPRESAKFLASFRLLNPSM